jgi:hypothetical protein
MRRIAHVYLKVHREHFTIAIKKSCAAKWSAMMQQEIADWVMQHANRASKQ